MKMWRVCFLMLICSGLFAALGLAGCGGSEGCDGDPCAGKDYVVPNSCLVIGEDDFACLCCKPSSPPSPGIPCNTADIKIPEDDNRTEDELKNLTTAWNEKDKVCVPQQE